MIDSAFVEEVAVYYRHLQQIKKKLPPPLPGLSNERIKDGQLVGHINTVHAVVIGINCSWLAANSLSM